VQSVFIYCYVECQNAEFHYAEYHNEVLRLIYCYAECHYAQYHNAATRLIYFYAECHYAECQYAECRGAEIFCICIT
jgi:hypothetical protein